VGDDERVIFHLNVHLAQFAASNVVLPGADIRVRQSGCRGIHLADGRDIGPAIEYFQARLLNALCLVLRIGKPFFALASMGSGYNVLKARVNSLRRGVEQDRVIYLTNVISTPGETPTGPWNTIAKFATFAIIRTYERKLDPRQ
jgi:hypothetical protein